MKNLLFALSFAVSFAASAQPGFKLTVTPPSREPIDMLACNEGHYLLKRTNFDHAKRNNGKLILYSAENKIVAQKDYQLGFKFNTMAITEGVLQKDKMLLVTAASGGSSGNSPYVAFWHSAVLELKIQQYNLSGLTAVGSPKPLSTSKETYYQTSFIHPVNGGYFALLGNSYNVYNQYKYQLFKDDGTEVFNKNLSIPQSTNWNAISDGSVIMNSNGDVAFVIADKNKESESNTYIGLVSAKTQQLYTKKLEVKGKLVSKYPELAFNKNGELIVAAAYGLTGKSLELVNGIMMEKFSGTLESLQHAEIPFNKEVIEGCKTSDTKGDAPGVIYKQKTSKLHVLENGEYVVLTKQNVYHNNPGKRMGDGDVSVNNITAIGLSDKFENQYQHLLHQLSKSLHFVINQETNSYSSGGRVYVFHGGDDDKVKNTKDEFDLYCSSWQHNKTQPKKIEVPRPYPDLRLGVGSLKEIEKNKILFWGQGNGGDVYTIMEIEEK